MGPVDELLCLGDSINQYRFSNEVVALLKTIGARMILGNHEEIFLSEAASQAREQNWVDQKLVAFVADQPHRRLLTYGGKTVLMIHSTPWEPRGEYIYPHNEKLALFAEAGADLYSMATPMQRLCGALVTLWSSIQDRQGRVDIPATD